MPCVARFISSQLSGKEIELTKGTDGKPSLIVPSLNNRELSPLEIKQLEEKGMIKWEQDSYRQRIYSYFGIQDAADITLQSSQENTQDVYSPGTLSSTPSVGKEISEPIGKYYASITDKISGDKLNNTPPKPKKGNSKIILIGVFVMIPLTIFGCVIVNIFLAA